MPHIAVLHEHFTRRLEGRRALLQPLNLESLTLRRHMHVLVRLSSTTPTRNRGPEWRPGALHVSHVRYSTQFYACLCSQFATLRLRAVVSAHAEAGGKNISLRQISDSGAKAKNGQSRANNLYQCSGETHHNGKQPRAIGVVQL